ncbi:MAG: 50S ribosomal protein L34e [Candidatus Aenigmatarchaeota archaeon]
MRRQLRSVKKKRIRVPGGAKWKIVKGRPAYHRCGCCGRKLNRKRLTVVEMKTTPKVQKRPERPLPEYCPRCMREEMKRKVRG